MGANYCWKLQIFSVIETDDKFTLICTSLSFYLEPSPGETRFPREIPSQELGIRLINPNLMLPRLNTSPNSGQQVTSMPEILELKERSQHLLPLTQAEAKNLPAGQQNSNYRELADLLDLMESHKESKVNYETKEINKQAMKYKCINKTHILKIYHC